MHSSGPFHVLHQALPLTGASLARTDLKGPGTTAPEPGCANLERASAHSLLVPLTCANSKSGSKTATALSNASSLAMALIPGERDLYFSSVPNAALESGLTRTTATSSSQYSLQLLRAMSSASASHTAWPAASPLLSLNLRQSPASYAPEIRSVGQPSKVRKAPNPHGDASTYMWILGGSLCTPTWNVFESTSPGAENKATNHNNE